MQHEQGLWWDESGFWLGLHTLFDPVRIPFFRNALEGHFGEQERIRILDIGSGAGFVATGVADLAEVIALDRSVDPLVEAVSVGGLRAVAAEAGQIPFTADSFDAVVCSEVLEHVADPEAVVAEAARITSSGGLFLFSTPTRTIWSRLTLIDAAQNWSLTKVLPRDLHEWDSFLSRTELEDLLKRNGFSLSRIAGVGARPRAWPRMVWSLFSLKTGRISYAEAGRRVGLSLTSRTSIAMIGYAKRVE